jgi:hypothetical protein
MYRESDRLKTFHNWKKSEIIHPTHLAKSGFYFTDISDRVQCVFCKGQLEGWVPGDVADEEHMKHFLNRCSFMQGTQSGNIPLSMDNETSCSFVNRNAAYYGYDIIPNSHVMSTIDVLKLVENELKIREGLVCKICRERQIDVVVRPCGHLFSCRICSATLSKCPICHVHIQEYLRVYFS